ncbi:hypothetical protein SRHO_G00204360 [Serrasalmus rhombeus]
MWGRQFEAGDKTEVADESREGAIKSRHAGRSNAKLRKYRRHQLEATSMHQGRFIFVKLRRHGLEGALRLYTCLLPSKDPPLESAGWGSGDSDLLSLPAEHLTILYQASEWRQIKASELHVAVNQCAGLQDQRPSQRANLL